MIQLIEIYKEALNSVDTELKVKDLSEEDKKKLEDKQFEIEQSIRNTILI